jgi:thymidylate synthase
MSQIRSGRVCLHARRLPHLQNHLEQVEQLFSREPLPLPELKINDPENKLRGLEGLLAIKYEHLNLIGYKSHGKIAAPVAV